MKLELSHDKYDYEKLLYTAFETANAKLALTIIVVNFLKFQIFKN